MSDDKRAFDLDFLTEPVAEVAGEGREFDVAVEGDGLRKTMRTTICGIKITRKWPWSKDYGKHYGSQLRAQFESPMPHRTKQRNVKYVAMEWVRWAAEQAGIELLDDMYPVMLWTSESHGGYRVRGVRTYTADHHQVVVVLPSYWNWEDVQVPMPKKPRNKRSNDAPLLERMYQSNYRA